MIIIMLVVLSTGLIDFLNFVTQVKFDYFQAAETELMDLAYFTTNSSSLPSNFIINQNFTFIITSSGIIMVIISMFMVIRIKD
jgi:hypothetical protein